MHVFPAGQTTPLEVRWAGGFNDALEKPKIRFKFSEQIDPDTVTPEALTITPAVPGVKLHAEEDEVIAEGAFDIKQHYTVTISPAIKGIRGFGLATPSKWGATFHPKESTIIFPQGEVFQRSASGLKFSLLQVNTGPLNWTLSEVPLDKLPAMVKRVNAYKEGESPLDLEDRRHRANSRPMPARRKRCARSIGIRRSRSAAPYLLEASATAADAAGEMVEAIARSSVSANSS